MYFNANGERISHARWKELYQAFKNRQEIIRARLSRRELWKMGLLSSAGMLVVKNGLSSRVYACSGGTGGTACTSSRVEPRDNPCPPRHRRQASAQGTCRETLRDRLW